MYSNIPKDKIFEGKKGKYLPITITLNANLGDDASLSEITISNTSVLATSVVIASSSAGPVTINEVASGSFKCIIKNTTGSQINDDATLVLNWVVI